MILELSKTAQSVVLQAVARLIDAAGPSGRIELMTGSGVVLSVLRFSYPCAGAPEDGAMAFGPIMDDANARGGGKAKEAIISDASGNEVFRCDVGEMKDDAVVQLNSTNIVSGGVVRLKSFTLVI